MLREKNVQISDENSARPPDWTEDVPFSRPLGQRSLWYTEDESLPQIAFLMWTEVVSFLCNVYAFLLYPVVDVKRKNLRPNSVCTTASQIGRIVHQIPLGFFCVNFTLPASPQPSFVHSKQVNVLKRAWNVWRLWWMAENTSQNGHSARVPSERGRGYLWVRSLPVLGTFVQYYLWWLIYACYNACLSLLIAQ